MKIIIILLVAELILVGYLYTTELQYNFICHQDEPFEGQTAITGYRIINMPEMDSYEDIRRFVHDSSFRNGCGDNAIKMVYIAQQNGLDARMVGGAGHVFAEIKENGSWVVSDPHHNGYWTSDGKRASLYDLYLNYPNVEWVGGDDPPPKDIFTEANYKTDHIHTRSPVGLALKQYQKQCTVYLSRDETAHNILVALALYVIPIIVLAGGLHEMRQLRKKKPQKSAMH